MPVKKAKDGEVNKLKKRIKKLEGENARLKSEVNSLEEAFKNTKKFIDDETQGVSVEKMIDAAKKGTRLKDVKPKCPECGADVKITPGPRGMGRVIVCGNCKYRTVEK